MRSGERELMELVDPTRVTPAGQGISRGTVLKTAVSANAKPSIHRVCRVIASEISVRRSARRWAISVRTPASSVRTSVRRSAISVLRSAISVLRPDALTEISARRLASRARRSSFVAT